MVRQLLWYSWVIPIKISDLALTSILNSNSTGLIYKEWISRISINIYGSFHIILTVDVADLNELMFFRFLSTTNRNEFFFWPKTNFFYKYRFFEFSKKWYFRHSKRTVKPLYLENTCSYEKFWQLRKLGFWLFFTEIVAKKMFKYFLTYKSKEINAKSFFSKFGPFQKFYFRGFL